MFLPVASPLELRLWAQTNQARIPKYDCRRVAVSSQTHTMLSRCRVVANPHNVEQVRFVDWDLESLTEVSNTTVDNMVSGLTGDTCWHAVFVQSKFAGLIQEILRNPADLVLLPLKRQERLVSAVRALCRLCF